MGQSASHRGRNIALAVLLIAAWLALDQATKAWVNSYDLGDLIAGPFLGLVQFTLVHNTGMAWGLLEDSTIALGILSIVVVGILAIYLAVYSAEMNLAETIGCALVIAGGLGNAIDRFSLGYVVDFIEPVFIDFPVFNIADTGVTCGFVLFILGFVVRECAAEKKAKQAAEEAAGAATDADPATEEADGQAAACETPAAPASGAASESEAAR